MNRLLSPRWIVAHVLVLVVAVVFVNLGLWQLGRLDDRRSFNRRLAARSSMPVQDVRVLFPELPVSPEWTDGAAYRRVEAVGTFDTDDELILRARSRNGIAGHRVVTPLRTADGSVLLVDRGWVELTMDEPPVPEAAPPAGRVRLVGVLFPSQVRGRFGPQDPMTGRLEQIWRIDIPRIEQQLDARAYPLWLHLERQEPAQTVPYPKPVPLPKLEEGPHLSYALQWFAFTLVGLVGYAMLIRNRLSRPRARLDAPPRERVHG